MTGKRIYAALKQVVEFRVERAFIQSPSPKQVPVERIEMAQIEYKPVPFNDWPLVYRFGRNHTEQSIGLLPGDGKFIAQFRTCHGSTDASNNRSKTGGKPLP